jgi:hypothetical protein
MQWQLRRKCRARQPRRSDGLSGVRHAVRVGCRALPLVLLVLWPAVAVGQVTTNPNVVEFTPSADHTVTMGDGRPMVTEYRFEVWAAGASAPMQSTSLGKPDPQTDGKVRTSPALLLALPVGQTFTATVTAVGPTGEGRSTPSNPFERRTAPAAPADVTLRTAVPA